MKSIVSIVLLLSCSYLFGQDIGNFIDHVDVLPETCQDSNGIIRFTESEDYITISWQDSDETGDRYDLTEGTYYLEAEDIYGCIEVIPIHVPNLECDFDMIVDYSRPGDACARLYFTYYVNGELINPNDLDFLWIVQNVDPEYTSTNPVLYVYDQGAIVTLTIGLNLENLSVGCCEYSITDTIVSPLCPDEDPNDPELRGVLFNSGQFRSITNQSEAAGRFEILVYGTGDCGTTDIRGYIIDDNDGVAIQANQDSVSTGMNDIGISSGYIRLTDNNLWATIPNGSTITIYEENHPLNSNLQPDPTDSDHDFNYIIPLENTDYFQAYQTLWDSNNKSVIYTDTMISTDWSTIELRDEISVLQIKDSEGNPVHGVAFGSNNYSSTTTSFPLYLTSNTYSNSVVEMQDTTWADSTKFSITNSTAAFTPDNISSTLQPIIDSLRNCFIEIRETENESTNSMIVRAYPNPFYDHFTLDFENSVLGEYRIKIYNAIGELIEEYTLNIESEEYKEIIFLEDTPTEGMLLIDVQVNNNYQEIIKLINIR